MNTHRLFASFAALLRAAFAGGLLAGCGVAETAAVSANQAEAAVEAAKEAEKIQQKLEQDIATAQEKAAQARAELDQ